MLDYSSGAKPLWSQVSNILLHRIKTNAYKIGDILPPELQLGDEFGVSRITIRQALDTLLNEGYISRKRGKGTIVLSNEKVSTNIRSSFTQIEEKGIKVPKKLLEVVRCKAPKEVADFFQIEPYSSVIMLKRSIAADEKLVTLFLNYVNPIVPLTLEEDYNGSFYQLLEAKGYQITSGKEVISAVISTEEDKKFFQLKKDKAIITRKIYGFSNMQPIELTYGRYIADGYNLEIVIN